MIWVERASGACRESDEPPGDGWSRVRGKGVLVRRREDDGGWRADHAFAPDVPLWLERGWERVSFRPAAPTVARGRGRRTGERLALAPRTHRGDDAPAGSVWVVLPDQPGRDAPATRPGSQRPFPLAAIRAGLAATSLAPLLTARLRAAGIPLERALEVLSGPPVSPRDAVVLRDLRSVLAFAERLASDLADLAAKCPDDRLIGRPPRQAAPPSGRARA